MFVASKRAVLLAVLVQAHPAAARAQSSITQEEALTLAFPTPARIERRTAYLDDAQAAAAARFAGAEIPQRVVTYYVGTRAGVPAGVAYFDSHRVRTLGEVLMIVVGTDNAVLRIEVLRNLEPHDYHAPRTWLDQFKAKKLDADLSLKRGIVNITGATLTSNAVTNATKRVLALHAVIQPFGAQ